MRRISEEKVWKKYSLDELFEMAYHGKLPDGFDRWELVKNNGWTVAHEAAVYGNLPDGFDWWELANDNGWTVAHVAVVWGKLPDGFDWWELANDNGWTVAHAAAYHGNLPDGFDWWELARKDGWTVAHVAAVWGKLPDGFDWKKYGNLKNDDGQSVVDVAMKNETSRRQYEVTILQTASVGEIRPMAERQKAIELEKVALLKKLKEIVEKTKSS